MDCRHVARAAPLHLSGPAYDERNAVYAFLETAFAAAQRRIVGHVAAAFFMTSRTYPPTLGLPLNLAMHSGFA
jgi:hypothetical protein